MLERHDTLRDNIRYAREQKNLSVKRLAELAGVGDSTIANFESRIAPRMTDRIAHQIARALGVTLEDLHDPGFRLRFRPTDAADRTNNAPSTAPDTPPAPDAEFEQLVEIMAALSPAGQELVVDFAKMLAEKARAKKAK